MRRQLSRKTLRAILRRKNRPQVHPAGFTLGVLPRALFGFGTAKGWAAAGAGLIFARIDQMNLLILVIWLPNEADVQIVP